MALIKETTSLDADENIEIYKGTYGSCSGCDWLEAQKEYNHETERYELSESDAKGFIVDFKPFAVLPKSMLEFLDEDTFKKILPANSRIESYDEFTVADILKMIQNG